MVKPRYPSKTRVYTATIDASGTVSDTIDLEGTTLVGLIFPAAMTGTAITFQGSIDGSTFVPLVDSEGTALSVTVSTSSMCLLVPADFAAVEDIRIVSGSAEAAERSITVVGRVL